MQGKEDIDDIYQRINKMDGRLTLLENIAGLLVKKAGLQAELKVLDDDASRLIGVDDDSDGRLTSVSHQMLAGWNEAFVTVAKMQDENWRDYLLRR